MPALDWFRPGVNAQSLARARQIGNTGFMPTTSIMRNEQGQATGNVNLNPRHFSNASVADELARMFGGSVRQNIYSGDSPSNAENLIHFGDNKGYNGSTLNAGNILNSMQFWGDVGANPEILNEGYRQSVTEGFTGPRNTQFGTQPTGTAMTSADAERMYAGRADTDPNMRGNTGSRSAGRTPAVSVNALGTRDASLERSDTSGSQLAPKSGTSSNLYSQIMSRLNGSGVTGSGVTGGSSFAGSSRLGPGMSTRAMMQPRQDPRGNMDGMGSMGNMGGLGSIRNRINAGGMGGYYNRQPDFTSDAYNTGVAGPSDATPYGRSGMSGSGMSTPRSSYMQRMTQGTPLGNSRSYGQPQTIID